MSDVIQLAKALKKTAIQAVESNKPVEVTFGKVTSTAPLKIAIDQKLILTESQLVIPASLSNSTQNSLQTNDSVILLRMQGGQLYLVVDKILQ